MASSGEGDSGMTVKVFPGAYGPIGALIALLVLAGAVIALAFGLPVSPQLELAAIAALALARLI